jgi:hypothetical protein
VDQKVGAGQYVRLGNMAQFADKAFVRELTQWIRFSKREALATFDGLYSRCNGNSQAPRWLGKWVVNSTTPQQQADSDTKKLRSSSGAIIVTSLADDRCAWVRAGQVYQRVALLMTSLNIKSAFLNQPIELADLRGQFSSAMALGDSHPQLLVRFGFAAAMPTSLRRPVEQVMLQT